MFNTGKIDAGCGVFDYKLEDPASVVPIDKITERTCWNEAAYPGHANTNKRGVELAVVTCCNKLMWGTKDGKGTLESMPFYSDVEKMHEWSGVYSDMQGTHYSYSVFWKEGCETADGKQSAGFPTEVDSRDGPDCISIQLDNWKQCKYEAAVR